MTNQQFFFSLVLALFASAVTQAQDDDIKVMLLYDMEGMSGATDFRYTTSGHTDQYVEGRKMMTADVNAAIRGLVAGGATEIIIVDGHGSGNRSGPDVLVDQLQSPAVMHYRDTSFDIYMDSYDASFDAIVAVGMHAAAGNQVGFLAHTYTAEDIEYTVNGIPFNESMLLAAGAARLKIPLIMVSGDDQLGKEIARNMPWVKYATVKRAIDLGTAEALPAEESARRIERAARDALRNLDDAQLPDWPGPYRFFLRYQDQQQARAGAMVPGAEVVRDGLGVQFHADDFEVGYRRSTRSISMASSIGWNTATMSVIAAQPNADALLLAIDERWYQRWIDPHSLLVEDLGTEPRRYWGAR
jgi:D-amino peptidase